MTALTIGMATIDDFNGVYFTLQDLRLHHDLADTELVVVDNYGCSATEKFVRSIGARYFLADDISGTAAPRARLFNVATGEAVLCCDSHVLFAPNAIARLKAYYRGHPDCRDLLQGPLVVDSLQTQFTHVEWEWVASHFGRLSTDPRGFDPDGEPFEIPAHGLGAFSCRRDVWPGFNPHFRGFGGEEGYLHEKFRQRGGRTLCLPFLRWIHRFARPGGIPYRRSREDLFRNYLIGFTELGLDFVPMLTHFAEARSADWVIEHATRIFHDDLGISLPADLVDAMTTSNQT